MKLLLDTHIWLWSLGDPARLGKRVRKELQDRDNQAWLSPVSTWEALLLNAKGRIRLRGDIAVWVARATANLLVDNALWPSDHAAVYAIAAVGK